ncbi:MAG TPA: hypothetical protein PK323_13605 [Bacteroidia bacterium]|nr:hypothetical protein [Bacteroidia bacterium]
MPIILHKFRNHVVNPDTEILILGTFNPDIRIGPTFFYGRPRNYLWQLLPGCWVLPSLKNQLLPIKQNFMQQYRIDFADLIHSVDVPVNQADNFDDSFIDGQVNQWSDIIALIDSLSNLRAVYFTRKTFAGITNIHAQINAIQSHCIQTDIRFCLLQTPARFANEAKQQQWIDTIINQISCNQA